MSKQKGFTLIELLVVVSIISLLVSILLPSLQKAKDIAKLTVCISNLRQIGTAIHLYMQDDDKMYFPTPNAQWLGRNPRPLDVYCPDGLYPDYIPNNKTFYCPAAFCYSSSWDYNYSDAMWASRITSYIYFPYYDDKEDLTGMTSKDRIMTDYYNWGGSLSMGIPISNHNGEIVNYLFGDTHVEGYDIFALGSPIIR